MNTANDNAVTIDPQQLVGLDAYTKDNEYIGTVSGLLPKLPASEADAELVTMDPTDQSGRLIGPEHLEIDGIGTVIQTYLIASIQAISADLRGRRITLPVTLAQIEAMPRDSRNRPIV